MTKTPIRPADRYLVFGAPAIGEAEVAEVADTMRSGWLGTGPKVARFVDGFKSYSGVKHACAVSSGTAAMHMSMLAAGVGPGDEVITTAMTFCSTVNAILHAGATPVLVDCEPDTMNIDPAAVESAITPRTRAILPAHFAGRACDMDAILHLASRHGILVISDCAHAIETEYDGRKVGTLGDFACYSFYVTKNVITGEGGLAAAQSGEAIDLIRTLSLHGLSKDAWTRFSDSGYQHYVAEQLGFKHNMTDMQAAIGIHQLARVEESWRRRADIWARYDAAFADLPVKTPTPAEDNTRHAYHLYTLVIDDNAGIDRDAFLLAMHSHNIGTGVHYLSIPEHPFYRERFSWRPEDFPHAMRIGRQTASLPLSAALSDDDVEDVVAATREVLGG